MEDERRVRAEVVREQDVEELLGKRVKRIYVFLWRQRTGGYPRYRLTECGETLAQRLRSVGDCDEIFCFHTVSQRIPRYGGELHRCGRHRAELVRGGPNLAAIEVVSKAAQKCSKLIRRHQGEAERLEKTPELNEKSLYTRGQTACACVGFWLQ